MEDRYLSKAKRIDNGEWVEGYLIFSFTGIPYIVQEYDHILEVMQMYEVDTVSYTHLDVYKRQEYDRLKNYEKLKIKATRYTRKRSLDANRCV